MRFPPLLVPLLLAGCMPLGLYYKEGRTVERANRDLLNCRVLAENEVPERAVTRVIPGPYLPPRRVCDAAGNCYLIPPHRLPPNIIVEDVNEDLRKEVVAQCMGDKGYVYVRIPQCSAAIAGAVTPKPTTVMPRLRENACVIRLKGGGWQIVTPG